MSENGNGKSTQVVVARKLPAARNAGAESIVKYADRFAPAIPRHVDRDQFLHALVTAANEVSSDVNPISVMTSALNCCKIGLMPGAAHGLAYFVPFKKQCQLIVGYRGFIDLVHRNSFVKQLYTNVILQGEDAREWADENGVRFHHEIPLDRELNKKNVTHAYCIANLSNGGRQVRVINRQQIDAAYRDTPAWRDNLGFVEMAQKTAIRRAAKHWKLTPEMSLAVHLDEQAELGHEQKAELPPELEPEAPRRRTLDELDETQEPDTGDAQELTEAEKAEIIEREKAEAEAAAEDSMF